MAPCRYGRACLCLTGWPLVAPYSLFPPIVPLPAVGVSFLLIMDQIFPLVLPYLESQHLDISLLKLILTDAADTKRMVIDLSHGVCSNISLIDTKSKTPSSFPVSYVSNPAKLSPLLVSVPPQFGRLKLRLSVPANAHQLDNSLVILKTWGSDTAVDDLQLYVRQKQYVSPSRTVSKIGFSKLALDDNQVIVNDTFAPTDTLAETMNVYVWKETLDGTLLLFTFLVWLQQSPVSPAEPESPIDTVNKVLPDPPSGPTTLPTSILSVSKLRKAFNFSIDDGPEYRLALRRYEDSVPRLKRALSALLDEKKTMDAVLRKLLLSQTKVLECIRNIEDNAFSALPKELGLYEAFSVQVNSVFDSVHTNVSFLNDKVLNSVSLAKMYSSCLSVMPHEGGEASMKKRAFEKSSKEYYDWLNKYLSNEKDRPELKLLLKRKNFELSKFDYFNTLNSSSNNQYFNQFVEDLFKVSRLSWKSHTLDLKTFRDGKRSQQLLSEDIKLYFFALARFNSEKKQLRQMIEACDTNEELTSLIKFNSLYPGKGDNNASEPNEVPILDLVFPTAISLPLTEVGHSSYDDQKGAISGILYALGGQGKPGWHKEWVVLKEGQLMEFSDWRKGRLPINAPIDVALASVKPMNHEKRHYCFEILTSKGQKHVFQAMDNNERNEWMRALYIAGQVTLQLLKPTMRVKTDLVTPPHPISPHERDRQGSPLSIASSSLLNLEVDHLDIVRSVEGSRNDLCADCGSSHSVEWVSVNLMVVVCLKCSSCHRNMGSHVSKIRSLKLDNFSKESLVLLGYVNNVAANAYLEYSVKDAKISNKLGDDERLAYVKAKYIRKTFAKLDSNPNLSLVTAVRKIDIPALIRSLNCGADPNIRLQLGSEKSDLGLIVVWLFEYSLRKLVETKEHGRVKKFFVVSELLLLNGCNIELIDKLHEDLEFSDEAKSYWLEHKLRQEGK